MTLKEFFTANPKVAIAFSGGVDSAYLLYAAVEAGAEVVAYYVKSAFQPMFEYEDAQKLAKEIGCRMRVLNIDVLADEVVASNPSNRCYYCKRVIFGNIMKAAAEDGFTVLLDGTNASDEEGDRPGMKALRELEVLSPLRLCGLTKTRIRELSREAGLFTWDKPAYACLATRIRSEEPITAAKLEATEKAEEYLFSQGFTDFRVRLVGDTAKLQVPEAQLARVLEKRNEILAELSNYYSAVTLDLKSR